METIIKATQEELFEKILKIYRIEELYVCKNKYILVKGNAPTMLVAHLDTVHKDPVKTICKSDNNNIWMSPQGIGGDDRCGVHALNVIHAKSKIKPWLLFTCDEEIGGLGAEQFCNDIELNKLPKELRQLKAIIEIDRKGKNDAVYYDCDNKEFEKYINSNGFKTQIGSFSDISFIAPILGVAAVNLSSGYYNAHTLHEYINFKHLNATIRKVIKIVQESTSENFPRYEYIEKPRKNNWDKYYSTIYFDDEIYADIPNDIADEYYELLDFYTEEELDEIMNTYGNQAIIQLYITEFGEKNHKKLKECYFREV